MEKRDWLDIVVIVLIVAMLMNVGVNAC